jgi:hypothetical protein
MAPGLISCALLDFAELVIECLVHFVQLQARRPSKKAQRDC